MLAIIHSLFQLILHHVIVCDTIERHINPVKYRIMLECHIYNARIYFIDTLIPVVLSIQTLR